MVAKLLPVLILAVAAFAANPFLGHNFYVNPSYQAEIAGSVANSSGVVQQNLITMGTMPSAFWIDVKAKIMGNDTDSVQGILANASRMNPIPLVLFIVYDLPNRDCHAKASNGEICCYYNADGTCNYDQSGDCANGIADYETNYINPLVSVFKQFPQVPIITVIEPDSLPNLATNMGDPHCGNSATVTAYETCIPYAINQLATVPNVFQYLDAAHGGWLGWTSNLQSYAQTVKSLNIISRLRGFATNVANYQPTGVMCPTLNGPDGQPYCLSNPKSTNVCCNDPCNLETQYNPCNNEMNYIAWLNYTFVSQNPGFQPYFITDTGRNGISNMRSDCANWCNIRGAGAGQKPTANTGVDVVDAFYWLKPPGESDGCTQTLPNGQQCPRYDSMCGSTDSIGSQANEPRAPQAGNWFDYEAQQLAQYAHF